MRSRDLTDNSRELTDDVTMTSLMTSHDLTDDVTAPLGAERRRRRRLHPWYGREQTGAAGAQHGVLRLRGGRLLTAHSGAAL